ncbi:MAG: ribosomal protein S18-alanine N-acetyltransferase [Lachnospiraceae bacterium]|nr:ribosomal protein S18-alanine N-acetyltransferase [Lachnospiraceae bacterium]
MNLQIRPLTEREVDAVCLLEQEAFSMPWHRESFLEMIEKKDACYLVAVADGQIAASCGLRHILGEGEITNVVVAPAFQRRGIAYSMIRELMRRGRQMGAGSFTLEVRQSNHAAIGLYEKLGFVTEGIRRNFYEKPREDALIMWKR